MTDTTVFNVVQDVFELEPMEVQKDLGLGDIPQWDSLGHVNLLGVLEKTFRITFQVEETLEMQTVADIQTVLARYGVAA